VARSALTGGLSRSELGGYMDGSGAETLANSPAGALA
jgi:hypothetical protein